MSSFGLSFSLGDQGADVLVHRNYSINQRMLFDENYNLAATQSLKNKDIPEGGAKGTILPSSVMSLAIDVQDLTFHVFLD